MVRKAVYPLVRFPRLSSEQRTGPPRACKTATRALSCFDLLLARGRVEPNETRACANVASLLSVAWLWLPREQTFDYPALAAQSVASNLLRRRLPHKHPHAAIAGPLVPWNALPGSPTPATVRLRSWQIQNHSIQPPPQKRGWLLSHEINEKSPTPTLRAVTGCFCGIFFSWPQFPFFSSNHESRHDCAISPNVCQLQKSPSIACYAIPYFLIVATLSFPLNLYENFFREHQYGFATQTFLPWFREQLIGSGLTSSAARYY